MCKKAAEEVASLALRVAEMEDHLSDQADIVLQLNEGPSQGTRSGHVSAAKFKALQAQVEEVTK